MSRREEAIGRKQQVRYQRTAVAVLTFFIVFCGALLGSSILASSRSEAAKEPGTIKYYTSIQIQQGDTLWSIADTYMSSEYGSIQDYILELKDLNQLVADDIHSGQYLTVPYYSSEFLQ